MDFSEALHHLKAGAKLTRLGWNGKDMFLVLIPASIITVTEGRPLAYAFPVGTNVGYQAHIDIKTALGTVVPWLASQTDLLADDWQIV